MWEERNREKCVEVKGGKESLRRGSKREGETEREGHRRKGTGESGGDGCWRE